jgi:hypothetical protein
MQCDAGVCDEEQEQATHNIHTTDYALMANNTVILFI